jgi:hypothetical protein
LHQQGLLTGTQARLGRGRLHLLDERRLLSETTPVGPLAEAAAAAAAATTATPL